MFKSLLRFFLGKPAPEPKAPARAPLAPAANTPAPAAVATSDPAAAAADSAGETLLLARADILNRSRELHGFAFSLREAAAGKVRAKTRRARDFIDELQVDTLLRGARSLLESRTAFITVWDGFLANEAVERLQGTRSVLILRPENPEAAPEPALLQRAQDLRSAGIKLALEDHVDTPWFSGFGPAADYFALDSARRSPAELRQLGPHLLRDNPMVAWLAWNVATEEDFEHVHRVGCEAFHGGFVTHRDDWQGNRLQPHSMRVAMLINRLREDTETKELAAVLKHDVALTYRLLRYVNAAAWGINKPITSIEHALVVLGRMPLRRWLALLLFGSAQKTPGAGALMEVALVRARFMELLGSDLVGKEVCEHLFMAGLFSLLDVIMRVPLDEALKPVNVPETVSDALLRREGPLLPYVEIAEALEEGDVAALERASEALGISIDQINRTQIEALLWVQSSNDAGADLPT